MKTIIVSIIASVVVAISIIAVTSSDMKCDTHEIMHDWECNFIIDECYTTEGANTFHYVDSYVRNIDHSITFVGEDGLLTRVPYPYFRIIVNPKERL